MRMSKSELASFPVPGWPIHRNLKGQSMGATEISPVIYILGGVVFAAVAVVAIGLLLLELNRRRR